MGFYQLPDYKEFKDKLSEHIRLSVNLLIVSVPGVGVTHFVKKFLEKEAPKGVAYINSPDLKLDKFNILDLDFDKNPNALDEVTRYMKSATLDQKFAVVVNTPFLLESDNYKRSFLASHVYTTYYFGARSRDYVEVYIQDMGVNLPKSKIDKIYHLSGGLGRLVKFLVSHRDWLEKNAKEIIEQEETTSILRPTIEVVSKCNDEILIKLGLQTSQLLNTYFQLYPVEKPIDIKLSPDLTFIEQGEKRERLTKTESLILKYMLEHQRVIEKDKVAEFKWGEGSYDKFSDQAVNKTMRRIDKKLKFHAIKTIPEYGFKIVKRT